MPDGIVNVGDLGCTRYLIRDVNRREVVLLLVHTEHLVVPFDDIFFEYAYM